MAVDVPGGILKQSDVRETVTNTEETSVLFNPDFARFDRSVNLTGAGTIEAMYINPEGTELYTVDTDDDIVQFTLSRRFDISSATLTHTRDASDREIFLKGIFFKPDGTKMYTSGQDGNAIDEYDLSTPWALSTATYLQEFSFNAQETNATGLYFREDGKQAYIPGISGTDKISSYHLDTAWDVSTASFLDTKTLPTIGGIFLSRDGSKVFWVDTAAINLQIYDLSTVFRISTATVASNSPFVVFPSAINLTSVFFNTNGSKMYLVLGVLLYEYTIKRGWR